MCVREKEKVEGELAVVYWAVSVEAFGWAWNSENCVDSTSGLEELPYFPLQLPALPFPAQQALPRLKGLDVQALSLP